MTAVLALLLIWAALIAFVLLAINRYRDHLEQTVSEEVIAYIGPKRLVRKHKEKPRV